jgi:hypothetical protein
MKYSHNILFLVATVILFIPLMYQFNLIKKEVSPLKGAFKKEEFTPLSFTKWISKEWQTNQQSAVKSNMHIQPDLVRLQHQLDYWMFKEYHMANFLEGTDGYLFNESWAIARCCKNELNTDSLFIFTQKLAKLRHLMHQKGKFFQIIIPPSKEELNSEFLPKSHQSKPNKSDYFLYTEALHKNNIPYWDLLETYTQIQDTSSYPVYSKTSVHWTTYGAHFTLIQLINAMNSYFDNSMTYLNVDSLHISKTPEGSDCDYEKTLNLMYRLDEREFAYPRYSVVNSGTATFKPKVITIGDSFYWAMKGSWMLTKIYHPDSKYLYYYSSAYSVGKRPLLKVKDMDIVEEFKTADAIVLINSSHNLENFTFGMENNIDAIIEGLRTLPNKE